MAITRTRVHNKAAAGRFALGRLKTGERNKTEQAYENFLTALQQAGSILWFKFEGIKLRLADNTFYTPDFAVMLASGQNNCKWSTPKEQANNRKTWRGSQRKAK